MPFIDVVPKYSRNYAYEFDCFDRGASRVDFANSYDLATLRAGGGGVNNVTTTISHNTLTTGGAINNQEGTRIIPAIVERAREFHMEIGVHLSQITDTLFRFGAYKDADEYCYIEFDSSLTAHWRLLLDDGTGAQYATEVYDNVGTGDYFLRLIFDSDGTPHWYIGLTTFIDSREISTGGITKKLTADPHYCEYYIKALAGAAKTAEIDYLETMKLKM